MDQNINTDWGIWGLDPLTRRIVPAKKDILIRVDGARIF